MFAAIAILGALAAPASARAGALVVTALSGPRPALVGRFASIRCTLRNRGHVGVPLQQAGIDLVDATGRAERLTLSPPDPPLPPVLGPGKSCTLRRFRRMAEAGVFRFAVSQRDAQGRRTPIPLADGSPASLLVHVVPESAIPRMSLQVTDPRPSHHYAPGEQIRLQVLPALTGGPDLSDEVLDVSASTPGKPWSISDPATAKELLRPSTAPAGFQVDFFRVPDEQRRLDLEVKFRRPIALASVALGGRNLNGEYHLDSCTAQAILPDGSVRALPVLRSQSGSEWRVTAATAAGPAGHTPQVISLRLRLTSSYKINIQSLSLQGPPEVDGTPVQKARVSCRWVDGFGQPLSRPARLQAGVGNDVRSPANLRQGYYGLVITTQIAGMDDARREFGFAVLALTGASNPGGDSRLGMVHAYAPDTELGYRWTKTLATPFFDHAAGTLDAAAWKRAIGERRSHGMEELPLTNDQEWLSDSTRPVSAEQLARLRAEMQQYFRATPDVGFWELGIEENLGYRANRERWTWFWPNLEAKVIAVRQAARDARVEVQLIYQVAELDLKSVQEYCASRAARQFDILALHPYAWPNFPAPEKWQPSFLASVQLAMKRHGVVRPIWFTEIGAPVNMNPGGFYGYPGQSNYAQGLLLNEHPGYLVKCHLLAFRLGVEKVFWYNIADGGSDFEYAEDNFGLIDSRGVRHEVAQMIVTT